MGGSFFVGNGEGIEELVKPIFVRGLPLPWPTHLAPVRGVSPFNGSGTAALASHPKSLRQIGNSWFFGTDSGSVNEPLSWEVRFLLGMGRG